MKGLLVVLEGLDRVGKTTHAKLLADRFKAQLLRFPDRDSSSGQRINQLLQKNTSLTAAETLTLFAQNRQEKK